MDVTKFFDRGSPCSRSSHRDETRNLREAVETFQVLDDSLAQHGRKQLIGFSGDFAAGRFPHEPRVCDLVIPSWLPWRIWNEAVTTSLTTTRRGKVSQLRPVDDCTDVETGGDFYYISGFTGG